MTNDADKPVQVDLIPLLKMRSVRTILQWVAAILLGGSLTNTGEISRFVTGDIPRVMRFSRHKSPAVLMVYDDRRQDSGGKLAAMLDGLA